MVYDPNKFKTVSPVLANFDFTDIANGTFIQTYYGLVTNQTTPEFFLSSQMDYGKEVRDETNDPTEYDLTAFTIPQTVKGVGSINFHGEMSGGGSTTYLARLYHVDGVSSVATAITASIESISNSADIQILLRLPITEKLFQAGDILRLTLDSSNNDGGFDISAAKPIKLNIPFKLDL